jgi:hypothetical protein
MELPTFRLESPPLTEWKSRADRTRFVLLLRVQALHLTQRAKERMEEALRRVCAVSWRQPFPLVNPVWLEAYRSL